MLTALGLEKICKALVLGLVDKVAQKHLIQKAVAC